MQVKNFVNEYRRTVMHALTSGIGNRKELNGIKTNEVRRILVSRPNARLGNQLLITPLMQELSAIFPNAKIDLFVRGGLATVLFQNYACMGTIYKLPGKPFKYLGTYLGTWLRLMRTRYDLAINAEEGSSSGRLSVKFSRSKYKIYDLADDELQHTFSDYRHMAKHPVYNLRKLLGQPMNKAIPALSICLSEDEKVRGKEELQRLTGNARKTLCLYTFATGGKCYSKDWWKALYAKLQTRFGSDYNLIEILPKENVSQIDFAAPSFYSTDLRHLAALMAAADIFVGADCGMMHLAVASGIPTLGLFSATETERYAPYGGQNMALDTRKCGDGDIVSCIADILMAK